MNAADRAQAELVGTVMLVSIVVLTASIFSVALLSSIDGDERPVADVDGRVTASAVSFTHNAGDAMAAEELRVVVRNESEELAIPFADGTFSDGSGAFDPGETWTHDNARFGEGDRVELLLVHDGAGELLVHRRTVVRAA